MRASRVAVLLLLAAGSLPAAGGVEPNPATALPPEVRQVLEEAAAGRKHAAERRIDSWLREHPDSVGGHVIRGDLRLDCLRVAGAIEDYRAVLENRPGARYAADRLFEALVVSLDCREAARLLERRLARDPADHPGASLLQEVRDRAAEVERLAARGRLFRWLAAGVGLLWAALLLGLYRRLARS